MAVLAAGVALVAGAEFDFPEEEARRERGTGDHREPVEGDRGMELADAEVERHPEAAGRKQLDVEHGGGSAESLEMSLKDDDKRFEDCLDRKNQHERTRRHQKLLKRECRVLCPEMAEERSSPHRQDQGEQRNIGGRGGQRRTEVPRIAARCDDLERR